MDCIDLQSFARCHAMNSEIDQIDCYEASLNKLFRDEDKCLVHADVNRFIIVYSYSRRCVLINAKAVDLSLSVHKTYMSGEEIDSFRRQRA